MKKWLIWCLTVLAMVCLIPGIALNAKAESLYCRNCDKFTDCEILGYKKYDSRFHMLHIKCKSCKKENDVIDSNYSKHTGGTETPTCTTGKTCEKCRAEYGILGHDGGEWRPNDDGTHTRRCKRSNCDKEETESCSGGGATCTSPGVCATCGGSYYGGHDLVHHEAKAPTCTGIGWDAYDTCKNCDYTTRKELPAQHDLKQYAAKAPTCTEPGWDAYEACSRCNYTTRKELPAQHDFVYHQAKPATCKEIGWDAYRTCSRCDYTDYVELPKLKNHNLRQYVTKAPTCTEIGFAYVRCWLCDYSTSQVLPVLNHDLKQYAAKAPTCTEIGWDAYEACSRSGCNYTTYVELPAQHDLVHHDAQAATCTEPGWDAYDTCSRCDYTTYVEQPALNHALVRHEAQAATCTEPGWNAYDTCKNCDYTTYAEVPALNHALVRHEAQAATCTEIGWNAYDTCKNCDYTTYVEQPALNHDLVRHDAKAATCTEIGWNAYDTCKNCNYTTYQEISALNHALVRHDAQAATCTEPGWDAYDTCSRSGCNYTTYQEIPALKHDLVRHEAQAATCTRIGWNAYDTCSRCDYTTYAELPALNHDLEQHAAKAPTCTEKGWNAYETCSRCDYTTYAELSALNHDLVRHDAKAATCTEPGWDAYDTCSRCDYTTYAELSALKHDLVHHEAQAATCTAIGWNAYDTCSRCDYNTYAEVPALNHDYQAVIVEPTCETDGYTLFTCSRCKDSYTANPTDRLGHQFGAWSPNGNGSQSAGCLRQGCVHIGSTDCRQFTFRTAEGGTLTFCPVCGQVENAAQLEKIEAATAWAASGSLSAEDVTARTNGEYLSVAFETAGSLTQPTGRVKLALPAGLLEGKTLVRIAPDGTQTELPFETEHGKLIFTLDFANSELPVMLFRLVPQTTAL